MARFLGIDIGDNALRGALVRTGLRKVEVERYVEIPLTQAPNSPGRLPELAEAGQNLLRALPAPPDSIVAATAGEQTSLRALELPLSAKKRVAEVVPFELEALLPYEPRDAVIDYQPIGAETDAVRVLVAAVLRKHVTETISALDQAGLSPRELGAGAAALDGLSNLLPELRVPGPVLILDMEDHRTDLCFMRSGSCVMARTIALGIEDMPAAADELSRELARTLASFRTAGFDTPAQVVLCGPGAQAQGAIAWLSNALSHPVLVLEVPPASTSGTHPGSAAYGKALALASRGVLGRRRINLRTGEFAPESTKGALVEHVNLIVTCAVVVVMTMMYSLKSEQMLLADEQSALRTQLATATQQVFDKPIDDAALAKAKIENPKSEDPLPRFDAFDALGALSGSIDESINHEVKRLRIEIGDDKREGRLELQGLLESLTKRDEVVSKLEKQGCFRDIEVGKTGPSGSPDRISYQLEAVVQCPGEGPKPKAKKTTGAMP
jgi:Tfp pilus assembly PilM family ATPase